MTNIRLMHELQERLEVIEPTLRQSDSNGTRHDDARGNEPTAPYVRRRRTLAARELDGVLATPVVRFNARIGIAWQPAPARRLVPTPRPLLPRMPCVIGGLAALAVQLDPQRARTAHAAGERNLTAIAASLLSLDRDQRTVLLDGPAELGAAQGWILPGEAALAIQKVLEGKKPERVWDHLDRAELHEQAQRYAGWLEHVVGWATALEEGGRGGVEEVRCMTREERAESRWQLRSTTIDRRARIDATARIGDGTTIRASVRIRGEAEIGNGVMIEERVKAERGARVGDDTILRRDTVLESGARLGDRNFISEQVEIGIQAATGSGTVVGTLTVIEERCRIGRNVRIGENVMLGAGAEIGDECVIEANTRLPEGTVVKARRRVAADIDETTGAARPPEARRQPNA